MNRKNHGFSARPLLVSNLRHRMSSSRGNQYGLIWLAEACALRLSNMLCPENVVNILQDGSDGSIGDQKTSGSDSTWHHSLMAGILSCVLGNTPMCVCDIQCNMVLAWVKTQLHFFFYIQDEAWSNRPVKRCKRLHSESGESFLDFWPMTTARVKSEVVCH